MSLKRPKLMEIEWYDSTTRNSGVFSLEDLQYHKLIKLHTVGYGIELEDRYILVKENENFVSFRHLSVIPKVNIVKVSLLKHSSTKLLHPDIE